MSQTNSAEVIPFNPDRPLTMEERIIQEIGEADAKIAMEICDQLAVSTVSLLLIVARVNGIDPEQEPEAAEAARCRFNRLKIRSDSLATMYTRAKVGRADAIVDEIIEIADTETDPHRAKVRVDTRKWAAGKFNRLLYGDDPIIQNTVNNTNIGNVDHGRVVKAELVRRLAAKAKKNALPAKGGGGSGGNFSGGSDNPPHALPSRMRDPNVVDLEVVDG